MAIFDGYDAAWRGSWPVGVRCSNIFSQRGSGIMTTEEELKQAKLRIAHLEWLLNDEANQLIRWANQSQFGGWSTHQVKPMQDRALFLLGIIYMTTFRLISHSVSPSPFAQPFSPVSAPRYVDEFTFRLNEGNVRNHTTARLNSFVAASVGKRLTYKRLIGKEVA